MLLPNRFNLVGQRPNVFRICWANDKRIKKKPFGIWAKRALLPTTPFSFPCPEFSFFKSGLNEPAPLMHCQGSSPIKLFLQRSECHCTPITNKRIEQIIFIVHSTRSLMHDQCAPKLVFVYFSDSSSVCKIMYQKFVFLQIVAKIENIWIPCFEIEACAKV